jgi:hypothetical protein
MPTRSLHHLAQVLSTNRSPPLNYLTQVFLLTNTPFASTPVLPATSHSHSISIVTGSGFHVMSPSANPGTTTSAVLATVAHILSPTSVMFRNFAAATGHLVLAHAQFFFGLTMCVKFALLIHRMATFWSSLFAIWASYIHTLLLAADLESYPECTSLVNCEPIKSRKCVNFIPVGSFLFARGTFMHLALTIYLHRYPCHCD